MGVRDRVEKIARKTLTGGGRSISTLCKTLGTMPEEVINAWVIWDTSITRIRIIQSYSSNAMRIAMHLHNGYMESGTTRGNPKVIDFIESKWKPRSIVEVGLGHRNDMSQNMY